MSRFRIVILVGLLAACAAVVSAPSTSTAPAQDFSSVWRLDTSQAGTPSGGTMFLIHTSSSEWIFLTANHVVEGRESFWGTHWDGRTLSGGRAVARLPAYDLALVSFPPGEGMAVPLQLAVRGPRLGDRVTVAGYPGPSRQFFITDGRASGGRRLSAQVWPGSSGAPVLDERGMVVGVVQRVIVMESWAGDRIPVGWMAQCWVVEPAVRSLLLEQALQLPAASLPR